MAQSIVVFSTVPSCNGDCGSQNHRSVPRPALRRDQVLNSVPRSKVIDRRACLGRGDSLSIRSSITDFDCRSGFFRTAANLLTRSSNEVKLALPNSKRNMTKALRPLLFLVPYIQEQHHRTHITRKGSPPLPNAPHRLPIARRSPVAQIARPPAQIPKLQRPNFPDVPPFPQCHARR